MLPIAPGVADSRTNTATLVEPVSVPAAVVPLVASPIFVHPLGVVIVVPNGFIQTVRTDRSPVVVPVGTEGLMAVTAAVAAVEVPAALREIAIRRSSAQGCT
jgi:hypothetical protein